MPALTGYGPNDPLNPYHSPDNFMNYLARLQDSRSRSQRGMFADPNNSNYTPRSAPVNYTSNVVSSGYNGDKTLEDTPLPDNTYSGAMNAPHVLGTDTGNGVGVSTGALISDYRYDNPVGSVFDIFSNSGYNTSSFDPIFGQFADAASALPLLYDYFYAQGGSTEGFDAFVQNLFGSGTFEQGYSPIQGFVQDIIGGNVSPELTELLNQDPANSVRILGDLVRAFSPMMTNLSQRAMSGSISDMFNQLAAGYTPEADNRTTFTDALQSFLNQWFGG